MNKTIYLLRHCEATGQNPEAELTEKGKEQAEKLIHFFEKHPLNTLFPVL